MFELVMILKAFSVSWRMIPASPTRHGFLLCETVYCVSEYWEKVGRAGQTPLIRAPWKSAFTSLECIP